jgi:hypothetical protein
MAVRQVGLWASLGNWAEIKDRTSPGDPKLGEDSDNPYTRCVQSYDIPTCQLACRLTSLNIFGATLSIASPSLSHAVAVLRVAHEEHH